MAEEQDFVVKNKKYELVPPDGGWGYMIWIAGIIVYSATSMFVGCFGMIYYDFLNELGMSSTSITLISGCSSMCICLAGYLTGPLLKILSVRTLALIASALFNIGIFGMVFVESTITLLICQGLLQGVGFGILYAQACSLINQYFTKKLFLSNSVVQTMAAVSAMIAPQFIKYCLEEYGYRGTLLLISAVSLQTFVAVVLMQPVERHMKKVEIECVVEEMKLLASDTKKSNEKPMTPMITLTDIERSLEANTGSKDTKDMKLNETEAKSLKEKIYELLDMDVLKMFMLSCASMGPVVAVTCDALFVLMLPQALYSMGWDKGLVAKALSLSALGDLVTRASFIFLSKWLAKIGSQEIYVMGIALSIVTRLGMLWSENVTMVLVYLTAMGATRCIIMTIVPLILADSFRTDQFTSAIGIFMLLVGVLNLIIGPAIGAVQDLTDSYPTVFYIITTCYSVILLLWSIELIYKRNKHKRRLQEEVRQRNAKKLNVKIKGKK